LTPHRNLIIGIPRHTLTEGGAALLEFGVIVAGAGVNSGPEEDTKIGTASVRSFLAVVDG
jgi:hypothetical protein